jgi:putative transposase
VAAHSKRAGRLGAHLVFIDESGLLLSPLVRRTLAPKGQTPILQHRAKDREKVSLISALTISPRSHQLGLYFASLCNDSFDNTAVAWFLRQLLRHLRGPVIVVWDRGPMHHGQSMRELREQFARLEIEFLPPYAPDLNPVEQLWSYLKWGRLTNFAAQDAAELDDIAHAELAAIRFDRKRLRNFWAASELPMPRALAS